MENLKGKMGGVGVQRLDELALDFAKHFLGTEGVDSRTINLYGQEREALEYLRQQMQGYLDEANAGVIVNLGGGGYSIDVGCFIS